LISKAKCLLIVKIWETVSYVLSTAVMLNVLLALTCLLMELNLNLKQDFIVTLLMLLYKSIRKIILKVKKVSTTYQPFNNINQIIQMNKMILYSRDQ
jgi:hypothetical protein